MINELDTVVLMDDIAEHGLKAGEVGAVVHLYRDEAAVEVECVTGEGETVAILILPTQAVRLLGKREILHARPLTAA